jgi:hypothetical protein
VYSHLLFEPDCQSKLSLQDGYLNVSRTVVVVIIQAYLAYTNILDMRQVIFNVRFHWIRVAFGIVSGEQTPNSSLSGDMNERMSGVKSATPSQQSIRAFQLRNDTEKASLMLPAKRSP